MSLEFKDKGIWFLGLIYSLKEKSSGKILSFPTVSNNFDVVVVVTVVVVIVIVFVVVKQLKQLKREVIVGDVGVAVVQLAGEDSPLHLFLLNPAT